MLQDIHNELRGVNIPCFIVLQGTPVAFSTAALLAGRGQLLLNVDDSVVKIDAVPGQTDQFAATKTSEDVHKDSILGEGRKHTPENEGKNRNSENQDTYA